MAKINFKYPEKAVIPSYKPKYEGHPKQIAAAAKAIAGFKTAAHIRRRRSDIFERGKRTDGARHKMQDPRDDNPAGQRRVSRTNNELSLGMLGMHGTVYANYAVQECDLLIAIGARFDDRVTGHIAKFAPKAKHIHIDIDPAEIGKNVKVDIPIVGDVKTVLKELIEKAAAKDDHEAWLDQIEEWKNKYPLSYKKTASIKPRIRHRADI